MHGGLERVAFEEVERFAADFDRDPLVAADGEPEARATMSVVVGERRFAPELMRSTTDVPTQPAFFLSRAIAANRSRAAICFALQTRGFFAPLVVAFGARGARGFRFFADL